MDTNAVRLSTEGIPGIPDPRIGGTPPAATPGADFQGALSKALDQVQSLQEKAAAAQERLVAGEAEEIHDVMIAAEEASVAFELMMEIRNRMLEAYHEIMRMQV
jgi:flagellar hook-basal body complex protein FliE